MLGTAVSLDNYVYSVYATLKLSYEVLPIEAQQFLHICAFFSNTMIPEDMFKEAIHKEFVDPPGGIPDFPRPAMAKNVIEDLKVLFKYDGEPPSINAITLKLQSLSLLSRSKSSRGVWSLNLHPLVSSWARDYFRIDWEKGSSREVAALGEAEYKSMATQVLISSLTEKYHSTAQGYLLPHVLTMLQDLNGLHVQDLTFLTRQLRRSSLWHKAESIDILIKNICELTNEPDHPSTIAAHERLARSYFESERYEPAVLIRKKIWDTKEKRLGQAHPETLFAKSQVGLTYFRQKRFVEAKEIHSEVVGQRISLPEFGPEHPSTINEMLHLIVTLLAMGELDEAKTLFQQVLDVRGDRNDYDLDKLIDRMYNIGQAIIDVYNPIRFWTILQCTLPIVAEFIGSNVETNDQKLGLEVVYLFSERNPDAEEICINIVERESAKLGERNVLMLGARVGIAWAKVVRGDEDAFASVLEAFKFIRPAEGTM
jgi:tetratricopeptide (TPR) repeat protein